MLLDELMPVYDVVERHRTLVRASPESVYRAIRSVNLAGGPVTRTLMSVRLLPAAVAGLLRSPARAAAELRARRADRRSEVRLADLERAGFRVVAERAPCELVLGVLGTFWTLRGGLCPTVGVEDFRAGPPSGRALAGWNFTVAPVDEEWSLLATETRVRCAPDARVAFRAYWLVVRPGSGLIRRAMLRAIRREAERSRS